MQSCTSMDVNCQAQRVVYELYTYYLAKALLSIGHQVHILHAEPGPNFSTEERHFDGLPCTVIKKALVAGHHNVFLEKDERVDSVFSQIVDSFQADVVHVNHLLHLSTNIPQLSQVQGVPVVLTLHDYWLQCARITLLDNESSLCEGPEPGKCASCCHNLYSRWPIWQGSAQGLFHLGKQSIKMKQTLRWLPDTIMCSLRKTSGWIAYFPRLWIRSKLMSYMSTTYSTFPLISLNSAKFKGFQLFSPFTITGCNVHELPCWIMSLPSVRDRNQGNARAAVTIYTRGGPFGRDRRKVCFILVNSLSREYCIDYSKDAVQ